MQEEKKKLVNQARKGDTHAFAKLYEEIYPDLYRFAFCMVRQPWKAEDVVSWENVAREVSFFWGGRRRLG